MILNETVTFLQLTIEHPSHRFEIKTLVPCLQSFLPAIPLQCLVILFIYPGFIAAHAQICLTVGRWPSFSLARPELCEGTSGSFFGIYEVLTTPQGGLSGSHIALDLPRPRMQLSPKHSDSQMVRWLQSSHFFNYHSSRGRTIAHVTSWRHGKRWRDEEFLRPDRGREAACTENI